MTRLTKLFLPWYRSAPDDRVSASPSASKNSWPQECSSSDPLPHDGALTSPGLMPAWERAGVENGEGEKVD